MGNIMAKHPIAFSLGGLVVCIGSMMLTRSIDFYENKPLKMVTWSLFNLCMGATLAPVGFIGGAIVLKAVMYTGFVVGGLSLVAMAARSDQFLSWGMPLCGGLAIICISSLGRLFMPPHFFVAHTIMENIVMYGGLVVFSGFILYDTQKIVHRAKDRRNVRYDPVNESIGIY